MKAKPLYVDASSGPVQVVRDGPSLRLRRDGLADARAPLRLLSRIVVSGAVAWRTEALLACMDAGVPVAFLGADGTPRGWALGADAGDPELATLLEDAILDHTWPGRHEDWLRAMERRSLLHAVGALGLKPPTLRPPDVWAECEERVDRLGSPVEAATLIAVLTGALAAHVADLMRRAGVPARFAAGVGAPVHLTNDFVRVLAWEQWPPAFDAALYFCRHGAKHRTEQAVRRRLVRFYEAGNARVEKRFRDLLWRLRWSIREWLT